MGFIEEAILSYKNSQDNRKKVRGEQHSQDIKKIATFLDTLEDLKFTYKSTTVDTEVDEFRSYLGRISKTQKRITRFRYTIDGAEFGIEIDPFFGPRITVAYLDCPVCFGEKAEPLGPRITTKSRLLVEYGRALAEATSCVACCNEVCDTCGSLLEEN